MSQSINKLKSRTQSGNLIGSKVIIWEVKLYFNDLTESLDHTPYTLSKVKVATNYPYVLKHT